MAQQQSPPASAPQPTGRTAQLGLVFLAGAATALIGHRLVLDRTTTRPAEIQRAQLANTPSDYTPADRKAVKPTKRIDLNRADRQELLQLPGVGPAMAEGILAYRAANGPFQRVEDLNSVRGIGTTTLERLKPWLIVDPSESDEPLQLSRKDSEPSVGKKFGLDERIDLNFASAAELERLPGIGPTLAQRIVEAREKKPFASLEDLRRVSGIGPKRLEQMKPFVTISN